MASSTTVTVPPAVAPSREAEACDYCGATSLEWRKCKLVCRGCRQIVMSCADLFVEE